MKNEVDCIRVGAPYDEPAFEALCREMSIWSTAQAALCAVFWRKGGEVVSESIGAGGVSALVPAGPEWVNGEPVTLAAAAEDADRWLAFLQEGRTPNGREIKALAACRAALRRLLEPGKPND